MTHFPVPKPDLKFFAVSDTNEERGRLKSKLSNCRVLEAQSRNVFSNVW